MLTLLAFVAFQSTSPSKVSLSRAAPVGDIVRELAKQAGVTLEVSPAVSSHTLIVEIHDKPFRAALEQIAWASFSRLVPVGGEKLRLEPDPEAKRGAEKAYRNERLARYGRALERLRAAYLGNDWDERSAINLVRKRGEPIEGPNEKVRMAKYLERDRLEPGVRAAVALLATIPPESLLTDTPRPFVFGVRPTLAELPLPGAQAILERYARERDTVQRIDPNGGGTAIGEGKTPRIRQGLLTMMSLCEPSLGQPGLHLFDEKGEVCEQSFANLWDMDEVKVPPKELIEAIKPNDTVPLSPVTEKILDAWAVRDSEAMRSRLADPVKNDPQSALMADVWHGYNMKTGRDVVLDLPDAWLIRIPKQRPEVPPLLDSVQTLWPLQTRAEQGWLVGRPPVPNPGWDWQVPRPALANLIKEFANPSRDRLDAAVDFLQSVRLPTLPLEHMYYLTLAGVGEARNVFDAPRVFLAFYGSLSPSQRAAWRAGSPVHLRTPGDTGKLLQTWGISQGVTRLDGAGGKISLSHLEARGEESLSVPPTEAILTASPETALKIQARYPYRGAATSFEEAPESFAPWWREPKSRPNNLLVRPVSAQRCTFYAVLPGVWRLTAGVDLGVRPLGAFGTMEQLPADLRKRIEAAPKVEGDGDR